MARTDGLGRWPRSTCQLWPEGKDCNSPHTGHTDLFALLERKKRLNAQIEINFCNQPETKIDAKIERDGTPISPNYG